MVDAPSLCRIFDDFLVRDFLVIVKKRIAVTSDGGSGEGSELGRVVCGVSRQPAG